MKQIRVNSKYTKLMSEKRVLNVEIYKIIQEISLIDTFERHLRDFTGRNKRYN